MKTLGDVLNLSSQFLKEKGNQRFRRTAEELISHVLKLKRLDLYMQFDRPVIEEELEALRVLLKRAVKGEPLEYISGEVAFYHCQLEVTPDVLIPRPETEILVDLICRHIAQEVQEGRVAWDLCTGSGCIGIAVKKKCAALSVVLSDLSLQALNIAKGNAEKNEVDVEILQGDLLAPFAGRKADFIFCNPPYITSKEFLGLDPSVKNFEPSQALVGGEDGLLFYSRLSKELPPHLNSGAKLFFEIGCGQGNALLQLFSGPRWKGARVEKDWAGHDRFFFLEFE